MKVGDYVTPNNEFFKYFNCNLFHLKIIKMEDNIAYLNESVIINRKDTIYNYDHITNSLHIDYLELDTNYLRKLKLEKINERGR
jgi:hypothetical protein